MGDCLFGVKDYQTIIYHGSSTDFISTNKFVVHKEIIEDENGKILKITSYLRFDRKVYNVDFYCLQDNKLLKYGRKNADTNKEPIIMEINESKYKSFTLYNGVKIPSIGYGTWQISNDEAYEAVKTAIEVGYRHIDTALAYDNEKSVGRAIKDSKVDREKLFITTKLPSHIKTYDEAIKCFNESLINLDLEYIDLYLIHAPWPWSDVGSDHTLGNIEVWKAFIDLYNQGKVKAIGVSNFHVKDLKAIIEATNFKPMVNQIRYFIGNRQDEITSFCQSNDILIQAYSPLATGELVDHEKIIELAKKYDVEVSKICLRYCLQKNTLPLPKSTNKFRMISNLNVDFVIDDKDMEYLDSLNYIATRKFMRD